MKANELMIGDFLRYKQDFPHTHLQGKLVKVCGIDGRVDVRTIDDGIFHDSEHPDWLEPIPITPEILEKNGFGDEEMSDDNYGNEIQIDLSLDEWTHEEETGAIISGYGKKIKYVHELQNALRLCGIEKEIIV